MGRRLPEGWTLSGKPGAAPSLEPVLYATEGTSAVGYRPAATDQGGLVTGLGHPGRFDLKYGDFAVAGAARDTPDPV